MQTKQRPCFASPCKLLEKRWQRERFEKHRRQVSSAVPCVDTRAPNTYLHLHVKLKQLSLEEGRNEEIRRENARLLTRMRDIMRSGGWTDSRNDYTSKSLNEEKRKRELIQRMRENRQLLERITLQMPMRCSMQWKRYLAPVSRAGTSRASSVRPANSPASLENTISISQEGASRGGSFCISADDEFSILASSSGISPAPTSASVASRSPIHPNRASDAVSSGRSLNYVAAGGPGENGGKELFLSVPGRALPVVRKTPTGSPARNRNQTLTSVSKRASKDDSAPAEK